MLSLTRKADYAVVALADLARRGASISSARELAESTQVPLPVLTNILHKLLQCGLVASVMGSKGGYKLARPAEEISLAEVIDAIEGPFRLTACCGDGDDNAEEACELEDECRIKEPVRRVHERLRHFLGQVKLAYVASETIPLGMPAGAQRPDVGDAPTLVLHQRGVPAPAHDEMQA